RTEGATSGMAQKVDDRPVVPRLPPRGLWTPEPSECPCRCSDADAPMVAMDGGTADGGTAGRRDGEWRTASGDRTPGGAGRPAARDNGKTIVWEGPWCLVLSPPQRLLPRWLP